MAQAGATGPRRGRGVLHVTCADGSRVAEVDGGGGTERLGLDRLAEARQRVPTDVTEDVLREEFLPTGWVDNKVCAIDDTWSGLRFALRRELR